MPARHPCFEPCQAKMKSIITILLTVLSLTFTSCKQTPKESLTHPDWTKLNLPNGWTLDAPKTFYTLALQGIDSEPGIIKSKQDSIYLQFDSGTEMLKRKNCSFHNSVEEAQKSIITGFYKEFYNVPSQHSASIDTIDNKVAVIIVPALSTQGTVGISISECETGEWLEITGTNLSLEKKKLVLEIFKTIKLTQTR